MNARKASAKAAREKGICPNCGLEASRYANFCGECGCDLKTGQTVDEWQVKHPRRRLWR